jgi:hypothetical protein
MATNELLNGPLIHSNGDKEWFKDGRYHREDGPTVENTDGTKSWWLNGQWIFDNWWIVALKGNYIVVERGIPTDIMFGELKLTQSKLLTAKGIKFAYDNLPGLDL